MRDWLHFLEAYCKRGLSFYQVGWFLQKDTCSLPSVGKYNILDNAVDVVN